MKQKGWIGLAAALLLAALSGCQAAPVLPSGAIACGDKPKAPPGRVMCPMIHDPVCGFDQQGEPLAEYGNNCQACAQPVVMSYRRGSCS